MKKPLLGLSLEELAAELAELSLPKYRVKQLAEWLYQKQALRFDEMTSLPKKLREQLDEMYDITAVEEVDRLDSADGKTSKFLLRIADGILVETVLMRQPYGNSICVSTQAGCSMGCAFCASGLHGLIRNLTPGEMFSEVAYVLRHLRADGEGLHSMVLMGSGEPLLNYENVMAFLRLLHADYSIHLSYRSITLSTSGIVPNIKRLAGEGIPITLSISLHAPTMEQRTELMPVNRTFPIEEVVEAGRAYGRDTGRRVTYEYILIAGFNDREKDAEQLAKLLSGQLAGVNLIPVNPVAEKNWKRPTRQAVDAFQRALERRHITATVRREMGADIAAACGQLRNKHIEK